MGRKKYKFLKKENSINFWIMMAFATYFVVQNNRHGIFGTKEYSALGYGAWSLFLAVILVGIFKKFVKFKDDVLYEKWQKNNFYEKLEIVFNILLFPISVMTYKFIDLNGYDISLVGDIFLGIILATFYSYYFMLRAAEKRKEKENDDKIL